MSLLLRKIHYCPENLYEMPSYRNFFDLQNFNKIYFYLLSCYLREQIEETNFVEVKAEMGKQIISKLPADFKLRNNGKFIAVTFTGRILAVCDNLKELNKELAKLDLTENYYIERLGFKTIAQI